MEKGETRTVSRRKMREMGPGALGVGILCFALLMLITPRIPQPQKYHDYADKRRRFFGIPYTLNVISNFPFLAIGLAGLALCYYKGSYFKICLRGEALGWACFYVGIAGVTFGSSYYHLNPNDATLVWDRVPMAVAMAGILTIFVIERVDEKKGVLSLIPFLLCGVGSVFYWRYTGDLRPYAAVETIPAIVVVLMAILIPPKYTHSTYWLWAAGCFQMARIHEIADRPTYFLTGYTVSGHTLKHAFIAVLATILTLMLALRDIQTQRISLLQRWSASWKKVKENNGCTKVT
ncbi:hypothetical protein DM860_003709 [Cuscuta australis]|uniref:Ceramidase n=1 Tax=Cuscuta australis TaxID=267555 RepID=A0A328DIC7_9ASTE|nr:hypothetical protein DM860_003709 [Cuscuta australis]